MNKHMLNIAQSSMILSVEDGWKVIWRGKDGTETSAIYSHDGSFVASQVHGGNYEVPANISSYVQELI